MLDALASHRIVTLADPHGDRQMMAFVESVVRHPRFPTLADDILVENGNARLQSVMDRYVAGEQASIDALMPVWNETTQSRSIN